MPTGETETNITWKSKRLSDESTKPPVAPSNILAPEMRWIHNSKIAVEFKGGCLKEDKTTFTQRNMVNLFLVYWIRYIVKRFN